MADYEFKLPLNSIMHFLRYGGIKGDLSEELQKRLERCKSELIAQSEPKAIWKSFALNTEDDTLIFNDISIKSDSLYKNLKGCKEITLMAVTIGSACDRLIKRSQMLEIGSTFIYQSVGAAMVEEYADHINSIIRNEANDRGLYTRPRFSPGYGDFAIEHQKNIFDIMPITKQIGITLTDSCLMLPSKSITAVIGLSETNEKCPISGCESCNLSENCEFRR